MLKGLSICIRYPYKTRPYLTSDTASFIWSLMAYGRLNAIFYYHGFVDQIPASFTNTLLFSFS